VTFDILLDAMEGDYCALGDTGVKILILKTDILVPAVDNLVE